MKPVALALALLALAASALASPVVGLDKRQPAIPYDQISIEDVTYGGSGCPGGSAAVSISDDKQALTVLYDDFAAQSPGTPAQGREFCQLSVKLKYPQGLSFAVYQVDTRGFAALDAGTNGRQRTTLYFQGETDQATFTTNFAGPFNDDYLFSDHAESAQLVWCPCGAKRNLQIKEEVSVWGGDAHKKALLTTDSTDFKVEKKWHIQWKWCGSD
ncbi:hypothetical protein DFJ74DRAFT_765303 [Hyaloraphidium curvatum]|nr:hypothetical protein DFJ74DRAFT_765303 [Hyaloraphidium curvatum]